MNDEKEQRSSVPEAAPASPQAATRTPGHADELLAAADPALTEDQALALLKRADLPIDVIEQLAKNRSALKLRKVKIALACHAHAPRHLSIPLIRQFYTFDLMKVALSPVVPADVKLSADETLIARLKTITLGERSTLARRASGRVAGALLLDAEETNHARGARKWAPDGGAGRTSRSEAGSRRIAGAIRLAPREMVPSPRCAGRSTARRASVAGQVH